ncbi:MAG: alpha-galactosidase, partial [Burkholderiales bacterium PBB5]
MTTALPCAPADYLVLHSPRCSVVLEHHADEAPIWRYWGPRLPEGALPAAPLRDGRPLPSFMLDFDQPLTVAPTFGVGWFGQSALLAHRNGQQFAQAFTACTVQWLVPGQSLVLHLVDAVAQLTLDVHLALDAASDVLSLRSVLTNQGDAPLDVQWLSAGTLPLPGRCDTVRSFAGQHMHEFMAMTDALSRSQWRRENRRGRTTQDCFPGAVVTTPGATGDSGLVFGAHLAWSGNSQQTIDWLADAQYQWQFGEWLAPGEVRLAPGASLHTPELLASCSTQGLDGLAANFHTALRARLPWQGGAMRPRPVHLNTWEGFYFDLQPDKVMALADAAAAVGVERFVVDDGWFHGRDHDRAALGDWWPDEGKFPQGLGPLVAHVNALGMEFGLWVEPEMVNPDSDLFRAHPDWALQLQGRPLITARNQLVLDISRPETADYLFDKISAQLTVHPIAYLKWDLNRDLTTAGLADGTPGYRVQVHAAYALMARLRAAHPGVEIESCSGGGGRIDFGVLQHSHRVWASDCIDALSRVDIQRGFLQFFPPEIMGAHVGTAPAHTTGRTQSLAFAAAVALPGHFGLEFDLRQLDDAARAELAGWITLYKQWRGLLHRGRVWRGEAGDGIVWQAHGDAAADELLLLTYRIAPTNHRYMPPLRLPMLDRNASYRVRQVDTGTQNHWGSAPLLDALHGEGVVMHG